MWQCSECGFENENEVSVCEECGHKRKKKKSRGKITLITFVVCVALIALATVLAMSGKYYDFSPKQKVTVVDSAVFGKTDTLKWTFYSDNSIVISGNGEMDSYEKRGQCSWRSYLEQIRKIVIEDGVKNVGANVFNGCGANEIVLGNSIEKIEKLAFANCVNLKEINFPESLKKIDESAFMGCLYLKEANMHSGVKSIAENAFDMCNGEFKISAPDGSVGAMYNAKNLGKLPELTAAEFDEEENVCDKGNCGAEAMWTLYNDGSLVISGSGDIDDYTDVSVIPWKEYKSIIKSIEICEGIENIGENAFFGCAEAEAAKLSCKAIGARAFYNCGKLKKVEISDGAETIGDEAFLKCSALEAAYIPKSVTKISYDAFKENKKGMKIYGDTRSYARFYALIKFIGFREG